MKKKLSFLLMAGMMVMGLTGCEKAEPARYALIQNNTTEENKVCSEDIWLGLVEYTETKEDGCQKYEPAGDKRKDYAKAIELAVEDGARVVVCVGEEMEVPVCEAQRDYQNVNFILVNGEPHKRFSEKTNIEENTISLYFNETQQGFALGYATVMNGFRNIGCMGGAETETDLKIASGFIQGAEAAGKDLDLAEGDIQIYYTFTGVDKLSPQYMSRALDWYKAGCEVIFTLSEGVRHSVIEAAKIQSAWIMGTNEECLLESDRIVTAAIVDYAGAVVNQIELIEQDAFAGEQVINCGIKEKGVTLITEDTVLSDNTVAQYDAICKKLAEGVLEIEETMVVPPTIVASVTKQ